LDRAFREILQLGVRKRVHGGFGPPQVEAMVLSKGADVVTMQKGLDPIAVGGALVVLSCDGRVELRLAHSDLSHIGSAPDGSGEGQESEEHENHESWPTHHGRPPLLPREAATRVPRGTAHRRRRRKGLRRADRRVRGRFLKAVEHTSQRKAEAITRETVGAGSLALTVHTTQKMFVEGPEVRGRPCDAWSFSCSMTDMQSWRTWAPVLVFASLAIALGSLTCLAREAAPSAEELVLRRQVDELRTLVIAAEDGALLNFEQMLVVVDQRLVQQLLASVIPIEGDVGGGFHVRIDSAKAAFGDGLALLHLAGQARFVERRVSAEVEVYGGLDVVELDPESGMLRARVNVYAVDIPKVDVLGVDEPARRLTQALAAGGLDTLLGPIEVPVRIEDRLRLPPLRTRRVSIPGLDLPVEAAVSSVKVFGGKLWVGVRASLVATDGAGCQPRTAP
jgi:hypothetical protein